MSVKIMGMVWDIPNENIKPNQKLVLLAYADHANHEGENIYPAIATIANKTGYTERNIQIITRELEEIGYLVDDGMGRKGTNKWSIPLDARGEKISPLKSFQGEKYDNVLGEKQVPVLGEKISPELTINRHLIDKLVKRLNLSYIKEKDFTLWIKSAEQTDDTFRIVLFPDGEYDVSWKGKCSPLEYFEEHYRKSIENAIDPGLRLEIVSG